MKKRKPYLRLALVVIALHLLMLGLFVVQAQEDVAPIETVYVAWSPDGREIAVAGNDSVKIIDVETQLVIRSFLETGLTRTAPIWSADGQQIGFGRGSNFEIWSNISNTPSQQAVFQGISAGQANDWSPNNQTIATANGEYIEFVDVTNYTLLENYWSEGLGRAWSIDWNTQNRILVGGSLIVQIIDFTMRSPTLSFLVEPYLNSKGEYISPTVLSAVWSPSEGKIAIGSDDAVRVLNMSDYVNEPYVVLSHDSFFYGHEGAVFSVSWHPSEQYLASSGQDGTIRIWDVSSGEQVHIIEFPENTFVMSVAWSPDGSQLAYGSPTGEPEVVLVPSTDILPIAADEN